MKTKNEKIRALAVERENHWRESINGGLTEFVRQKHRAAARRLHKQIEKLSASP